MERFYSTKCGLYCQLKDAEYQSSGSGAPREISPGKAFRFSQVGKPQNGTGRKFGVIQTEDPDIIAYCKRAIAAGSDEIISEDEYKRQTQDNAVLAKDQVSVIDELKARLAAAQELIAKQTVRPGQPARQ